MKKLLDCKPNVDEYLAWLNVDQEMLKMLGINKDEDLKTVKDFTDLAVILRGLKGHNVSKQYIDEQYAHEAALESLNGNTP